MKEVLASYIEQNKKEILEMADFIFDNPELGLQEFQAVTKIKKYLLKHHFQIEENIYGFETAFRASYQVGKGGPSIGLLCEYDALEGLGHACAHHMQGPSIIATAVALQKILKDCHFNIIVYGTPAEETLGAKVAMSQRGAFSDIDVALMMHGSSTTTTDVKSMALSNFDVIFHGVSAHAALAPEKGRSALDGVLLMMQGIEFLREHVNEDTRMHYTITDAGGAANVVPKLAKAKISLRSYNRRYLDSVVERVKKVIQGAAMMTETSCEIIQTKALDSKIPVISLNELLMENARLLSAPRITPPREKTGSTDFGNVMYRVPGSCIRIAFVPEGSSSHSDVYLEKGKTEEAHNAILLASKILAYTAYDLISNPETLKKVQEEFKEKKEG
ncbi:M20 family peptidase [Fusobacterium necrophorum]|uniref:Peptidase M20 domain-containing protein 2 n=1 Tax=Fusobacterium necrophorum TaxID=859 RepID=A0A4Q2L0E6_9FUSO|nr:M20 family metallopeptidase [Fusobacterium necrophorum]RXZ69803.1 M20 family peptidase [Fusobacterium necrophorum]